MLFSIIVVCLNPGEKLKSTLRTIHDQTLQEYEVIVKDGGSRDGSVQNARECMEAMEQGWWERHVRLYEESDTGIYEAMNQAVAHAVGEYVLFLNCGDVFYSEEVLEDTARRIYKERAGSQLRGEPERMVFYGDTHGNQTDALICSPPVIDGFACYRNIPCHQSCFYSIDLCREKPYDPQYRIRADYEHFLWCYYVAGAKMYYLGYPVSSYEGGGYSESRENRQRDQWEHRRITKLYMSSAERFRYRLILLLTLAPLRRWMAGSQRFSGFYHGMKEWIYGKRTK